MGGKNWPAQGVYSLPNYKLSQMYNLWPFLHSSYLIFNFDPSLCWWLACCFNPNDAQRLWVSQDRNLLLPSPPRSLRLRGQCGGRRKIHGTLRSKRQMSAGLCCWLWGSSWDVRIYVFYVCSRRACQPPLSSASENLSGTPAWLHVTLLLISSMSAVESVSMDLGD